MSNSNTTAAANGLKSGSNLERVLSEGHFAVTAELGPPKGMNTALVSKKIGLLKGFVDAANVTDNQTGIVRLSSIATGILMNNEGLEPIIQMTCRDRNRLAIQSDLLGANVHGIRNVLCLSGDHMSFGNHPTARDVHDIDSMQLVRMLQEMRDENKFQSGDDIRGGGPEAVHRCGCGAGMRALGHAALKVGEEGRGRCRFHPDADDFRPGSLPQIYGQDRRYGAA